MTDAIPTADRFAGCLVGLMVGDALGLPREGLTPSRARRLFGDKLRHGFFFGRGMISDDSEHACLTAAALASCDRSHSVGSFSRNLAWRIRWWLLCFPAGMGLATLRAGIKLWLWFPPEKSAVQSAGNGPAMRSPVIGLFFSPGSQRLELYVAASTLITHKDPRALRGALAIAIAAHYAATHNPQTFSAVALLDSIGMAFPPGDAEALRWLALVRTAVAENWTPDVFAARAGFSRGVSGYMYHTLPAVFYAWLSSPFDYRQAVGRVILMGGDADTTGAICGALCGASVGMNGIPRDWIDRILDYPRTVAWTRQLGLICHRSLLESKPLPPPRYLWPVIPLRNLLFLIIVLLHGFRRMLPPY